VTGDAAPCRDPAMRAELGERACTALMTRADWRTLLEVWADQLQRAALNAVTWP
jgi:hypothetical protein